MTAPISKERIQQQLEKILHSAQFIAAEKLRLFLRYVVEQSINGRTEHVKQYTIAVEALGYDEGFNPQEDSIIRIQARRLRWALDEYYHGEGIDDPILIKIPKGTYVPNISAPDASNIRPAKPRSETSLSFTADQRSTQNPATIAVLPFEFQGGESIEQYWGQALTDAITVGLSKFESLGVIASHSTRQFKGSEDSIGSIAQVLGVRFIVSGTIHKDAHQIRVGVQFTDAKDGALLWAESVDRNISNSSIFATLDCITRYILINIGDEHGTILRQIIPEIDQKRMEDISSFDSAYLYHNYNTTVGKQPHQKIRSILEHIVEKESLYALGWAHLAAVYGDMYSLDYDGLEDPLKEALFCAKKAIALDSRSQESRANLALIRFLLRQHDDAIREAEKAIPINPNSAYVVSFCGFIIGLSGNLRRGREIIDEIDAFKPNVPGWLRLIPFLECLIDKDYQSALAEARRFRMPDEIAWDPICRASAAALSGDLTVAAEAYDELIKKFPETASTPEHCLKLYLHFHDWVELVLSGLDKAEKAWRIRKLSTNDKIAAQA